MINSKDFTFLVESKPVTYGDNRRFFEYKIVIQKRDRPVGIEHGPRRETATKAACNAAARKHVNALKKRRLFVVRVTRKHISDGEARNCNTCAIAQALWHNQDRMGFPKRDFSMEVSPYGAFGSARGLVLRSREDDTEKNIPPGKLPLIVTSWIRSGVSGSYDDTMMEWAMMWDEWAESRHVSLAEWREYNGRDKDERPCRPSPCSFVLDLEAFKSPTEP